LHDTVVEGDDSIEFLGNGLKFDLFIEGCIADSNLAVGRHPQAVLLQHGSREKEGVGRHNVAVAVLELDDHLRILVEQLQVGEGARNLEGGVSVHVVLDALLVVLLEGEVYGCTYWVFKALPGLLRSDAESLYSFDVAVDLK
jgi:hypothetical protein